MRQGFSLVELSIVLVVIALITGGVLLGQSLMRSSQLRSVVADYHNYITAEQAFETKYNAIPGDMTNATSYWGKDATNCNGDTGTASVPTGTCNGNGDAVLTAAAAISAPGEIFGFWRQLADSGFIGGSYSGIAGPTTPNTGWDSIPGTNVPAGKLDTSGWSVRWLGNFAGDTHYFATDYGNLLQIGAKAAGNTATGGLFKPEEAAALDAKLDDGKPGTGSAVANWDSCATSSTTATANYSLSVGTAVCTLNFPKAF